MRIRNSRPPFGNHCVAYNNTSLHFPSSCCCCNIPNPKASLHQKEEPGAFLPMYWMPLILISGLFPLLLSFLLKSLGAVVSLTETLKTGHVNLTLDSTLQTPTITSPKCPFWVVRRSWKMLQLVYKWEKGISEYCHQKVWSSSKIWECRGTGGSKIVTVKLQLCAQKTVKVHCRAKTASKFDQPTFSTSKFILNAEYLNFAFKLLKMPLCDCLSL